jgi:kynureninase
MTWKAHYARSLNADPDRLHFAAHSHHPWPDVTRDAQLAAWDDAARLADDKWGHVFGTVVPKARGHVARFLNWHAPNGVVFAPNTHEFLARLLSCFDHRPIRVLTTDGEFHSAARQFRRSEESGAIRVHRVAFEPFPSFPDRFRDALATNVFDLVFLSLVGFLTGQALTDDDLDAIVGACPDPNPMIVVDGYHAFLALPLNLGRWADWIFYLGGGYKYAQAGEGACFLAVPAGCQLRPRFTGWFASFDTLDDLADPSRPVAYGKDADRFWGSTFDPSGLYRFNAVADWMTDVGLTVEAIHAHVRRLQLGFLDRLARARTAPIAPADLVPCDLSWHGHFLSFRTPRARAIVEALHSRGVIVDSRGQFLRFGFGIYQDDADLDRLFERLEGVE